MTRDELEAAIWRHLTARTHRHITEGDLVDRILAAADAYAATEVGILTPAQRREVLHAARDDYGGAIFRSCPNRRAGAA